MRFKINTERKDSSYNRRLTELACAIECKTVTPAIMHEVTIGTNLIGYLCAEGNYMGPLISEFLPCQELLPCVDTF